jgi:phage shock protein A
MSIVCSVCGMAKFFEDPVQFPVFISKSTKVVLSLSGVNKLNVCRDCWALELKKSVLNGELSAEDLSKSLLSAEEVYHSKISYFEDKVCEMDKQINDLERTIHELEVEGSNMYSELNSLKESKDV